jgi:hypothetical protein
MRSGLHLEHVPSRRRLVGSQMANADGSTWIAGRHVLHRARNPASGNRGFLSSNFVAICTYSGSIEGGTVNAANAGGTTWPVIRVRVPDGACVVALKRSTGNLSAILVAASDADFGLWANCSPRSVSVWSVREAAQTKVYATSRECG